MAILNLYNTSNYGTLNSALCKMLVKMTDVTPLTVNIRAWSIKSILRFLDRKGKPWFWGRSFRQQ